MPEVLCKICGKEFTAKPSWIEKGWGKYCSSTCQYKAQAKGKLVKCEICGEETWRKPSKLKHSKSGKFFCSKSCLMVWKNQVIFVGENHPNWKGGIYRHKSPVVRNKIIAFCRLCKTKDKRILAIHHIDHNKRNNSLDNLTWLCHNCHFLVHHEIEEKEKFMAAIV